jgi:hypothetical protein
VSRQLPGLPTAEQVATRSFQLTQVTLARVVHYNDIGVLSGPPGCGKTYALEAFLAKAAAQAGHEYSYLEMPVARAVKEFNFRMLNAILGGCDDKQTNYQLTDQLAATLHGNNRIVVVDEAHNLNVKGLQRLRHLHQTGEFTWTLILAGATIAQSLFGAEELKSRADGLVMFLAADRRGAHHHPARLPPAARPLGQRPAALRGRPVRPRPFPQLGEVPARRPRARPQGQDRPSERRADRRDAGRRRRRRLASGRPPMTAATSLTPTRPAGTAALGPVVRVFGAEEDLARSLRLSALNQPGQHRVAVLVRPDMRQRSWLAGDLLSSLGVSHSVTGISRDADSDWLLVHTWLLARDITDLLVLRAEWLPEPLVQDLLLLGAGCGARVWLLMTPPRSNSFVRLLDTWTGDELDWAAFLTAWQAVPGLLAGPAADAAPAGEQLSLLLDTPVPPLLPDDDFPTFRAACRQALTPPEFTAVDALLTAEQRRATSWLTSVGAAGPTPPALAQALLTRYDRCASTGELLLQVDLARLLSTADATPRRAQRTPALWQRLEVYRQPHRSAGCALAAAGLDLTGILALRVGDVRPDGAAVHADGSWLPVEPGTAVYLRAMRTLRQLHGAAPHDPLLAHPDGTIVRERALADAISAARAETGVAVTSRLVARKRVTADRWYTRWGLSVQRLDGPR